jgi:hypothetical protein
VSADNGGYAGGRWIEVELGQVMNYVESAASEFDEFGWRELRAKAFAIDIAADGCDGSNGRESAKNGVISDVPGVEDVIDFAKHIRGVRA